MPKVFYLSSLQPFLVFSVLHSCGQFTSCAFEQDVVEVAAHVRVCRVAVVPVELAGRLPGRVEVDAKEER